MTAGQRGYRDYVLSFLPGTRMDIKARSGIAEMTVRAWIKQAHLAGDIHIASWHRPPKGRFAPVYANGPGVDAICNLKPTPQPEIRKRYFKKLKKEGRWAEYCHACNAPNRARRLMQRKLKNLPEQSWLSALLP